MIGITWDKKHHSVGHEELDKQHKAIIDLINQLSDQQSFFYGAISGSRTTKKFDSLLAELKKHILEHLAYEEEILEQLNYDDLRSQKESHHAFINRMSSISLDNNDSKYELANFLIMWWDNHIIVEDMKYKSYVEKQVSRL